MCVCVQTHIVTQMVKSLPAVQDTRVQSLGQEGPLEKGMATHSSILVWKIPWTEESAGPNPWGHKESDTTELLTHTHTHTRVCMRVRVCVHTHL